MTIPRACLGTAHCFLYDFPVHEFELRWLRSVHKQELIRAGDRLAVAVSGGADSVALLTLLLDLRAELGIVLSVAHVNHKLRGRESDEDEEFVGELARQHGLEFHVRSAPLAQPLAGIEAAARKLRYDFFRELTIENRISKIATAHTLDDQAETVLLRMLRGTGIRGLAGIHPRIAFERGEVVRPLLGFRRAGLAAFLRDKNLVWREDSSNNNPAFLRNRVRLRLLPLLAEDFGAAAVENLADLAEIARAEEEIWEARRPEVGGVAANAPSKLAAASACALPVAAQRRLIRTWLEANLDEIAVSFRLIEEVRDLAHGPAGKKLEVPGGGLVRRTHREICLEPSPAAPPTGYEYSLPIPGVIDVPELDARIEAALVQSESVPREDRNSLLDPGQMPKEITVRNWRAGDRFRPAHTQAEKKVKELLADRHLTGAERKLWPLAVAAGGAIVWVRGLPTPSALQPRSCAAAAVWIRLIPN